MIGTLYIVSTPIGNLQDMTERARKVLADCDVVCCEDTRHSGMLLKKLGINAKKLLSVHKLNEASKADVIVEMLLKGSDIALISDAGTPLISDPGERVVQSAVSAGIEVVAIPGASSVLAALVVSGFELDRWSFEGFLERKGPERKAQLSRLKFSTGVTLFFESPNRIAKSAFELAGYCEPERRIVIARELTKMHEEIWRGTVMDISERFIAKVPTKGEIILVVDKFHGKISDPYGFGNTLSMLEKLFRSGYSRHDALAIVTLLTERGHKEAYDISLDIWNNR